MGTHALTLDIVIDTCGPEVAKVATFIVSPHTTPCRLRYSLRTSPGLLSRKKVSLRGCERVLFRYLIMDSQS